jgi:hypothetical protein
MGVSAIIHKAIKAGIDAGLNCVISDSRTPDALKDLVGNLKDKATGGWTIQNYLKNPIVLFNGLADFPAATMKDVRWKDNQLVGRLTLAPEGTSARHDELRKLIKLGILKGISCSFRPIESVPLKGGVHYLKQELISVSVCAFGCHPDALLQAKADNVSTETIRAVFKAQNAGRYTEQQRQAIHRRGKEAVKAQGSQTGKHATQQELEAIIRKKERGAEEALAKAKKPLTRNATISERLARETLIVKCNEQLRSLRRAREGLARTRNVPSKVASKPQSPKPARSEPVKDHPDQIIWRGEKIPIGWSYAGMRQNWQDPES